MLSQIDARRSLDKQFAPQLAQRYPDTPRFTIHQDTTLSLAAASRGASELSLLAQWIIDPTKVLEGTDAS
ncbi:hypothetical protein [Trichocoleus sp. FACHB-46]|uniref:Uncharacterized protein n=1 Tax=Trichocoleus desertorum GB2-A4 TaxID=2933944 RepID=A0ABV0JFL2_9CYAN|nr:hypothetical protein [Trichocoleus sp. FACHB-46]